MVSVIEHEPKPPIQMLPYQRLWDEDESRFKAVVKSVRTGYTFAQCAGDAMRMVRGPFPILWMSGDQDMSKEAAATTKKMLDAIGVVSSFSENVREIVDDAEFVSDRIALKNGSRAIYFSSNPAAMRSFGGNVRLDEIAKHKNQKLAISVALGRAARGHRVAMISSPNGAIGEFYEMADDAGLADQVEPPRQPVKSKGWSWHWCDIYRAIRLGLEIDIEELRAAFRDAEIFAQEFLCKFLDAEGQLIATDLVREAVSEEASMALPTGFRPRGDLYMGIDVGRVNDLFAKAIIERIEEYRIVRAIETLHKAKFSAMKASAKTHIPLTRRTAIDASGLGMETAEELVDEHPGRVEAVSFGPEIKAEMAFALKRLFEDHLIKIPNDPLVISHVTAVKRIVTTAGNTRYDGKRNKSGHIDIFWALGLADHASERLGMPMSEGVCVAGRGAIDPDEVAGRGLPDGLGDDAFYAADEPEYAGSAWERTE